jgi:hypothetical protein
MKGVNILPVSGLDTMVTAITAQCTAIVGIIPTLATAALGVAVLLWGVRVGWRLVKSLAH